MHLFALFKSAPWCRPYFARRVFVSQCYQPCTVILQAHCDSSMCRETCQAFATPRVLFPVVRSTGLRWSLCATNNGPYKRGKGNVKFASNLPIALQRYAEYEPRNSQNGTSEIQSRVNLSVNFPLAKELDFILNHVIAEMVITSLVVLSCIGFALQTVDLGENWNIFPLYVERGVSSLFAAGKLVPRSFVFNLF